MSEQFDSIDKLIRYARTAIADHTFDLRSLRKTVNKASDAFGQDDRYFFLQDDIDELETALNDGTTIEEIMPRMWLFSPDNAHYGSDHTQPAVSSEESYDTPEANQEEDWAWYDEQEESVHQRGSVLSTDEQRELESYAYPSGSEANAYQQFSPDHADPYDENIAEALPYEETVQQVRSTESRLVTPSLGQKSFVTDFKAILDNAETAFHDENYVTALSMLNGIKAPEQVLSEDLYQRYVSLRDQINDVRLNKKNDLHTAFEAVFDDVEKSLDDVVTALNALLNEELTFNTEESDLRTLRTEYTNPDVWTSGKRERYLAYYKAKTRELPRRPLNVQYDLLRQEAPKLEKVVSSIDAAIDQDLYNQVSELWDDLKKWRNRLQQDLGRVLSVAVDRDYVGLIQQYSTTYKETDTLEYPPGSRKYNTVKAFLVRIKQEYASYVLTQSARLFQGVVENASTLLEPGAVTNTFVPHMRLMTNTTLGQIDKDLKLALINMKPSAYLRRFSDVTVQGNRSIDPEPSWLEVTHERDQFFKLREDYLPTIFQQYQQVINALRSESLEELYEALLTSNHPEVQNRVNELETRAMQAVTSLRADHDNQYASGDFWALNHNQADFEDYLRETLSKLNEVPMLSLSLPAEHPHFPVLEDLTAKLNEQISYFRDVLPKLRADAEKKKRLISQHLENLAAQFESGAQVNVEEIRESLNAQRMRVDELKNRYRYPVGGLLGSLKNLETLNAQKTNSEDILKQMKSSIREIYDLKQDEMPDQATLAATWERIVYTLKDKFEVVDPNARNLEKAGHYLYLYAQAKMNYHTALGQPISEIQYRAQLIDRAVKFLNRIPDSLDFTVYTDLSDLMERYLLPFRTLVENEAERTSRIAGYAEQIVSFRNELWQNLQNVQQLHAELARYLGHFEQCVHELRRLENEREVDNQDEKAILRAYIEREFFDDFQAKVSEAADEYLKSPEQNMQLGDVVHRSLRAFKAATMQSNQLLSGKQLLPHKVENSYHQSYRERAQAAYIRAHQTPDAPLRILPFDLPLEAHEYAHWFEIVDAAYNKFDYSPQKLRAVAEVAAYFLISTCTNERTGRGDVDQLLFIIEQVADIQQTGQGWSKPLAKAMGYIRDANMLYVMRDMVVFAQERSLFEIITQRQYKGEIAQRRIDAFKEQGALQLDILKMDVQSEVQLMAVMWQRRLDALLQFLNGEYVQVRRTLRTFGNETKPSATGEYVVTQDRQSQWTLLLRRRYTYIIDQMKQMYSQLISIFVSDTERPDSTQDARTLKERLDIAIFLTEVPDDIDAENAQRRGRTLLARLTNDLDKISVEIEREYSEILSNQLPSSLERATAQMSGLSDNLSLTVQGLNNISGISPNSKNRYTQLDVKVSATTRFLKTALEKLKEGQTKLYQVVRNEEGANYKDNWNLERIQNLLLAADSEITTALNTSNLQVGLPKKGEEDFERFKTAFSILTDTCKTFSVLRKKVSDMLNQPTVTSLDYFAQLVTACDDIIKLVQGANQQLKAQYSDLEFQIPAGFFLTTIVHKPSIANLPKQLEIQESLNGFRAYMNAFTGLSGDDLETRIEEWRNSSTTIVQIDDERNHFLVAYLVRERAERWNSVLDRLSAAYLDCYREWLDVGAWCAYYMPIFHSIYQIHNLGDTAPAPDDQSFIGYALRMLEVPPLSVQGLYGEKLRLRGDYTQIAREIDEYVARREKMKTELAAFVNLGVIPRELVDLVREKMRSLQESETSIKQATGRVVDPQYPLNFDPFAGVNWEKISRENLKLVSEINASVNGWLDNCDLLVEHSTHGLGARRLILENLQDNENPTGYLTILSQTLSYYAYNISRAHGKNRKRLEDERSRLERIYLLLAHQ